MSAIGRPLLGAHVQARAALQSSDFHQSSDIFQTENPRLREMKEVDQGHTVGKCQVWIQTQVASGCLGTTIRLHCLGTDEGRFLKLVTLRISPRLLEKCIC